MGHLELFDEFSQCHDLLRRPPLGHMAFGVQAGAPRMVTDSAGRTVEVLERVERIYAARAPAMDPDVIVDFESVTETYKSPAHRGRSAVYRNERGRRTVSANAARDPSR